MSDLEKREKPKSTFKGQILAAVSKFIGPDKLEQLQTSYDNVKTKLTQPLLTSIGEMLGERGREILKFETSVPKTWEVRNGKLELFGQRVVRKPRPVTKEVLEAQKTIFEKKGALSGIVVGPIVAGSMFDNEVLTIDHLMRSVTGISPKTGSSEITIPDFWYDGETGIALHIESWSSEDDNINPRYIRR